MADGMRIDVGLDLQEMYDRALVMSEAFLRMAEQLADGGRVCVHPCHRRKELDDRDYCDECGRFVDGIPGVCEGEDA